MSDEEILAEFKKFSFCGKPWQQVQVARAILAKHPSAEALVQAALEAAVNACDNLAKEYRHTYACEIAAKTIRALDKQQIIESCKEKS